MTAVRLRTIEYGGDDWLLASFDSEDALALSAGLQAAADRLRPAGRWLEVVPGLADLSVRFDTMVLSPAEARSLFDDALQSISVPEGGDISVVDIPVCYGGEYGPDLDMASQTFGLDPQEIIALHTGEAFLVQMMGFAPGFAYCGETPEALTIDRLAEPRKRVEAGSVGIAGRQTCLYSLAGPGGWPLIGRTPLKLFDPAREAPFLLKAGTKVRFCAIGEDEFRHLAEGG